MIYKKGLLRQRVIWFNGYQINKYQLFDYRKIGYDRFPSLNLNKIPFLNLYN